MGQLIILIILILLNAFFAASEMAFVSLNDVKVDIQAKEGNKKAKKIQKMLRNPSRFLSTIQIGITLAGFLSSAFASDAFASQISPYLNKLIPSISIGVWNHISIILVTIILSYFTLIFGELVPKRIAMKYYEKIAFSSIGIINAVSIFMLPFVKLLTFSTNLISKIFGISETDEETVTEEEIRMMTDVGEEKGTIEENEGIMIDNVFEFNDKVASEIMIPRNEIYALNMNLPISKVIEELTENDCYSRIPIYDETIDQIEGIVYVKDIVVSTKNKNAKIKNLKRDAYFIPETKPINEVFEELRKRKLQIAIVVDEYGGTSGLITMEDIVEEIVGEIYDEYDEEKYKYEKVGKNIFMLAGDIPIYEARDILKIELEEGDYDTLSGYLIHKLGRIPGEKEKCIIETENAIYKIEKVAEKRIERVKVTKKRD